MEHVADIAITKEQMSGMPVVTFPGNISIVDTPDEARQAIAELRSAGGAIGFDTETRPSFRKGHPNTVALIQLSTDSHCFLFRLKKLGFTDELVALLEDEEVVKIGVSLRDDFLSLHKLREFNPAGFIDLQDVVGDYDIHDMSLQKIYAIIFGERISKGQRLSNWEAASLTHAQQAYASTDAWACRRIYYYLIDGRFDPSQSPYHVSL